MNAETIVSFLVCDEAGLFIELRAEGKAKTTALCSIDPHGAYTHTRALA